MLPHGSTDIQELINFTYDSLEIIHMSFPLIVQFQHDSHCWQCYAGCVALTTAALLTRQRPHALNAHNLALVVSNRRQDRCLSSCSVSKSTLHDCKYSLRDAFQCIAQPNTTLLDCILCLMQYLYDPGILPSSAN